MFSHIGTRYLGFMWALVRGRIRPRTAELASQYDRFGAPFDKKKTDVDPAIAAMMSGT